MQKGITFPESLENLLILRALGERSAEKAREGRLSRKELSSVTAGMLELSDRFNGIDATPLGDYMNSRRHRAGYFLYFLPANFAKAWAVAAEMSPTLSDKQELSILDVGSGPGSLSLGFVDFLARQTQVSRVRVTALDSSKEALADWRFLVGQYANEINREVRPMQVTLDMQVVDLERGAPRGGKWDVILFGDSLNELFRETDRSTEERARLVGEYGGSLREGGSIVIIEPALKDLSRALEAVRDRLVSRSGLHIYAPCVRQGECPMLAVGRERDWCHTSILWTRPKVVRRIDELAGRGKLTVKFAYLVARKESGYPVADDGEGEVMRVVGDRLGEKGKAHALLCGESGCSTYALLKRDECEGTAAFIEMHRGDIVSVDRVREKGDGLRLDKESSVRLLERFSGEEQKEEE